MTGPRSGYVGWAAILIFGETRREMSGTYKYPGTNQTAELVAALRGLQAIKRPMKVTLLSDSEYLLKGLLGLNGEPAWIINWERNKWKAGRNKKVTNLDLWRQLLLQKKIHQITPMWVRGHTPLYKQTDYHRLNARCDELAVAEAIRSYERSLDYSANVGILVANDIATGD